jgi:glycosyltransferase involved in cell wall biosynthesis
VQKVILITNIPTPYRIPLFNELDRQLRGYGIRLYVVFGAIGYARRKWLVDMSGCEFDHVILPSRVVGSRNRENLTFTYPGLFRILRIERPLAVITNEFSIATVKLWVRSLVRRMPYIIWSGGVAGRSHRLSFVRNIQRRLLVKGAAAFVAYGTSARKNLVGLGADPEKVHIAINTVDTRFFREKSDGLRSTTVHEIPRIVYVGHLTQGKRIDLLLRAAAIVHQRGVGFAVDIVGDGPELEQLRDLASNLGVGGIVNFTGFRQKDEVASYLGRARCFVFPSEYDIWGLVLVEAMACAVPCISSVRAGATQDLITVGKTGYSVDFSDIERVADYIHRMIVDPELAVSMGKAARDFIEKHASLEVSARGFIDALSDCGVHVNQSI